MAGVGFNELVLLFIIGLLILGPERLPRVASQIGRWVGRARRTANQMRYQLEREIALADIKKPPKSPPKPPKDSGSEGANEASSGASESASRSETGDGSAAAERPDAASAASADAAEPTIHAPGQGPPPDSESTGAGANAAPPDTARADTEEGRKS